MAKMTARDIIIPCTTNVTLSIKIRPAAGRFELKKNMVQPLDINGQFTSLPHEDSEVHIQNFLKISDTCTPTRVSPDYVTLILLTFSLSWESRRWLKLEPTNYITSWDDLA